MNAQSIQYNMSSLLNKTYLHESYSAVPFY